MFVYASTDPFTINGHSYASGQTNVPQGFVAISAGFQNYGDSTKVYASQLFITDKGGGIYTQLVNTSGGSIPCVIWVVLYYEEDAVPTDVKLSMEDFTITPLPSTEEE